MAAPTRSMAGTRASTAMRSLVVVRAVLGVFALALGCLPAVSRAADAPKPSGSLAVSVTTPRSEQFSRVVVATGSVFAWQEAVIGSEVGGYRVAAVNVDVGDKVRKGQELVRLAGEMLSAEHASKKAAKAQADAQLITATSNLRRAESILSSGAVSDSEHERLRSEYLAAQARVEAAVSDLTAAELKLRYTRVLSPDDGVITARMVVVGQIAQAGGEMLRLLRQSRVEWRAEVPEGRMREVKIGQAAHVTTADGSKLVGKVRSVAPTVQSGTRTGLVYVDLPASENARPGMFARGEIETSSAVAATVPLASIVVRDGYSYVYVVTDQLGVQRRRIETGTLRDGRMEVRSGLTAKDRVVTRGAGFLKDGDHVRIIESSDGPESGEARAAASAKPADGST